MSVRSSHQRWLAVLAAGGVAAGGVVALTSVASATPGATGVDRTATTSPAGHRTGAVDPGAQATSSLLAQTRQLSEEITAARKRLAALGGAATPASMYVTNTSGVAAEAAALAAERSALNAQAAAMTRQERALQTEARQLAAEAAALGKSSSKPPTQGGTGASGGSGGGDG